MTKYVFCFGSNEAGVHGAGAAKTAYEKYGARWGCSYGHVGNSFAIPTKDEDVVTLSVDRIDRYVQGFIAYAQGHRKLKFKVSRIGSGLGELADAHIAPMFKNAPANCQFDEAWEPYLGQARRYWGTEA